MKINYLEINGYKNLNDFYICFEENQPVHALIGNNASGKSNVLEALTYIFNSFYQGLDDIEFNYSLKYSEGSSNYELSNKDLLTLKKDGKVVPKKDWSIALPRNLFLYYSGGTERFANIAVSSNDDAFDKSVKADKVNIKYISYIGTKDLPVALLSSALFGNSIYQKVCNLIGIADLSAPLQLFLKRPKWSKTALISKDSFWNATGTVQELLHSFSDLGKLEIIDKDSAIITIDSIDTLKPKAENSFDLFIKFKLLMQVGILKKIDFNVEKEGQIFSVDSLSEGEKQISQLLCFLEATKEHRALFLLDEIDAYLHPEWQRTLTDLISDIDIKGQIIFTTHSPLTLGKMKKKNIRRLEEGKVIESTASTYNRDVVEILTETMKVSARPKEVEKQITSFNQAALAKNKELALKHYEVLETLLSDGDPFRITSKILLKRLGEQE